MNVAGHRPGAWSKHLILSLDKLWDCYRKASKRCQKKFSEDSVHELRVATRRLLSQVGLIATPVPSDQLEDLRDELKRRLDSFDDLRDTQVQLGYIGKSVGRLPELKPLCKKLRSRERCLIESLARKVKRSKTKGLGKSISCL